MHDLRNPLDPFGLPGDPMEEVLSLQSYALSAPVEAGNTGVCCQSAASCNSSISGVAVLEPVEPFTVNARDCVVISPVDPIRGF